MVNCSTDTVVRSFVSSFEDAKLVSEDVVATEISADNVVIIGHSKDRARLCEFATEVGRNPNVVCISVHELSDKKVGGRKRAGFLSFFSQKFSVRSILRPTYRAVREY